MSPEIHPPRLSRPPRTSSRGRPLRPAVREWWLHSHRAGLPPAVQARASRLDPAHPVGDRVAPQVRAHCARSCSPRSVGPSVRHPSPAPAAASADLVERRDCGVVTPLPVFDDVRKISCDIHQPAPHIAAQIVCSANEKMHGDMQVTATSDGLILCDFCQLFGSDVSAVCRACGRGMTAMLSDDDCFSFRRSTFSPHLSDAPLVERVDHSKRRLLSCPRLQDSSGSYHDVGRSRKRSISVLDDVPRRLVRYGARVKRRRYSVRLDPHVGKHIYNNYEANRFCAA